MPERYSTKDGMAAFGLLVNAMSGGGDHNAAFPRSDAEDMSCGARFIPGEVTLARRAGQTVRFISSCASCCWYWEMPDGSRIYHFEGYVHDEIGRHNHGEGWSRTSTWAGPCPHCGNPFTRGGRVTPEEVANGAYDEVQAT